MEEISRGCANAGNIMTAHNSLYIHPIVKYGTEAQNVEHVSPFISGSLNKYLMTPNSKSHEWLRFEEFKEFFATLNYH